MLLLPLLCRLLTLLVILTMALFLSRFFFSSRRRHTRCLSDWSSDVCSSDLAHQRLSEVALRQPPDLGMLETDVPGDADGDSAGLNERVLVSGKNLVQGLQAASEIGRASCRESG